MKKNYLKPQAGPLELLGGRFMISAVSTDGTQVDHADVKGHKDKFNTDEFWKDDVKETNRKVKGNGAL
jgi:hypothetical protein